MKTYNSDDNENLVISNDSDPRGLKCVPSKFGVFTYTGCLSKVFETGIVSFQLTYV